jgi:hypothetical protein
MNPMSAGHSWREREISGRSCGDEQRQKPQSDRNWRIRSPKRLQLERMFPLGARKPTPSLAWLPALHSQASARRRHCNETRHAMKHAMVGAARTHREQVSAGQLVHSPRDGSFTKDVKIARPNLFTAGGPARSQPPRQLVHSPRIEGVK